MNKTQQKHFLELFGTIEPGDPIPPETHKMMVRRARTTLSKRSHKRRSRKARVEEIRVSLDRISEFEEEMSENTHRDSVT